MFGKCEYLLNKADLKAEFHWLMSTCYILLKYNGMDANRLKNVAHLKIQ
jgi:hypothetical protein